MCVCVYFKILMEWKRFLLWFHRLCLNNISDIVWYKRIENFTEGFRFRFCSKNIYKRQCLLYKDILTKWKRFLLQFHMINPNGRPCLKYKMLSGIKALKSLRKGSGQGSGQKKYIRDNVCCISKYLRKGKGSFSGSMGPV